MGFRFRSIPDDASLSDEAVLQAIGTAVPHEVVKGVVADLGVARQHCRKLPAELVLLLVVAMNLFQPESLEQVLVKLMLGLRLIWPDHNFVTATKSAISQARYRVGSRPMVELFERVCRPMATPSTKGAFLFGLRLMALDPTVEDVADTPANVKAFGRHTTDRGDSAFPQIQPVYLVECGTHAVVGAGVWPCHTDIHAAAQSLLRSVGPDMLLMWDAGLHSFDIASKTRARGAHFLSRVPAGPKFTPVKHLRDGTYLSHISLDNHGRPGRGNFLVVRIIEYTIKDPARPGYLVRHRLMTSLLDSRQYPALDLVCAYHERWEIEITIDELDTHQRLPSRPLRSRKPDGDIQELYGLLIAHYAIRRIMHDSAVKHDIDPDRLSFTDALRLIGNAVPEFQQVVPEQWPVLYERLLNDVARHRLPPRANRANPRVVKRKISKFLRKRPEHRHWPQPTMTFREAIAMLN